MFTLNMVLHAKALDDCYILLSIETLLPLMSSKFDFKLVVMLLSPCVTTVFIDILVLVILYLLSFCRVDMGNTFKWKDKYYLKDGMNCYLFPWISIGWVLFHLFSRLMFFLCGLHGGMLYFEWSIIRKPVWNLCMLFVYYLKFPGLIIFFYWMFFLAFFLLLMIFPLLNPLLLTCRQALQLRKNDPDFHATPVILEIINTIEGGPPVDVSAVRSM